MRPDAPVPFSAGEGLAIRGETAGEGMPIVLCHGLTATRRYVVHGSRTLERSGHRTVSYDARGHGESDPAPPGTGYGYPELIADLESVVANEVGEGRLVLAGHSMGAHTAIAYALRHPELLAGLVAIGPSYGGPLGEDEQRYWDGLAVTLEDEGVDGFIECIDRHQGIAPRWRDSVLRFTRQRMLRHHDLEAISDALRQVPRSAPFEGMDRLASIEVPALVVASNDAADPGHPHAIAASYAELLPQARLIGEAEGESPLAWQGGRLSREIAAFCAEPAVASSYP